MESLEERGRARVQEILGGHMVGRWRIVGRVRTEEGADGGMTWDDDIVSNHGIPLAREVWKGN